MLRLLHTADVHLGARHTDMGERASLQRERQFAAFRTTVDLAISEGVDLVLIAGDLFDSNTQPRRTVERVAAELGRLARASIRTAIIPGTHDVYDGASIYRAYDLAALARAGGDWIAVLTPEHPEVVFASLDAIVYGRVFDTKRAPRSPLAGLDASADTRAAWRIGMVHGALAIPGRTDHDEVVFSEDEIAATNLDYLALGHWHSQIEGQAGTVKYAYSGAPEPVAVDQDGAGEILLVTFDERGGVRRVSLESRTVGQTRCESLDLDVSGVASQPELIERLARHADPNLILDVRLTGLFPDGLDLDVDEVERDLGASFLRLRVRDLSIPGLSDEPPPPADTVLGAFVRIVEARIAALESPETAAGLDLAAAEAFESGGGEPDAGAADPASETEPIALATEPEPAPPDAGELDSTPSSELIATAGAESGNGTEPSNGTQPLALEWPELVGEAVESASAIGSFDRAESLAVTEAIDAADETAQQEPPPSAESAESAEGAVRAEADAAAAESGAEPAEGDDERIVAGAPSTEGIAEAGVGNESGDEPAVEPVEVEPSALEPPEAPPGVAIAAAAARHQRETADELADLREVLRLGRHLLEGRQVTL